MLSMNQGIAQYPAGGEAFTVLAKPCGSRCNLQCSYCYYLGTAKNAPPAPGRMQEATLERFIAQYIGSHATGQSVHFIWQGGEPTLAGLDFYRQAVNLQARLGAGRHILNSIQTNGALLDEEWCRFLAENGFLVGLSLDGPADIHDRYRKDRHGSGSHEMALRTLELLRRHRVEFNILACVTRTSALEPERVYQFLRTSGARVVQFIPVVEPAGKHHLREIPRVTDESVRAHDYGIFMSKIFSEWFAADIGQFFVMNFEWALAQKMGLPGGVCHHSPHCSRSLVLESGGSVYSCDHFVDPAHLLGNLAAEHIGDMAHRPRQDSFCTSKSATLPQRCLSCKVLHACWGGCPKHRLYHDPQDERPFNYLCAGYLHYFGAIADRLDTLASALQTRTLPSSQKVMA